MLRGPPATALLTEVSAAALGNLAMFVPWPHSGLMAKVGRNIMGFLFLGDLGLV